MFIQDNNDDNETIISDEFENPKSEYMKNFMDDE